MNLGQIIVWCVIGLLAGTIATQLYQKRGYGMLGNMLIGLVGAVLGGLLFQVLNIRISGLPTFTFSLADLLIAVVGALLLLVVLRMLRR